MRHIFLTASAATLLLLGACNVGVDSDSKDVSAQKSTVKISEPAPDAKDRGEAKVNPASKENLDGEEQRPLPEHYQGLDPNDISRAELDELLVLRKAEWELIEYKDRLSDWHSQDVATRGPKPEGAAISKEDEKRLKSLNAKLWSARERKRYETYGTDVISKEEIDELIALEKQRSQSLEDSRSKYDEELENWEKQDPAVRGEQPSMDESAFTDLNPRIMELQVKIDRVDEMHRLRWRLQHLSPTHNVLLLDSDITEWSELQEERSRLEIDLAKAVQTELSDKQFQESDDIKEDEVFEKVIIDVFPKHKLKRMLKVEKRINAIEAPLKAAEIADSTQKNMSRLSENSGVSVSSREIQETIDLKVELDRITTRSEIEAIEALVEEGEFPTDGQPQINSKDAARIKEIRARIKEISAPMDEALLELK